LKLEICVKQNVLAISTEAVGTTYDCTILERRENVDLLIAASVLTIVTKLRKTVAAERSMMITGEF